MKIKLIRATIVCILQVCFLLTGNIVNAEVNLVNINESVEKLKNIWGRIPDQDSFHFWGDEYIKNSYEKIKDKMDLEDDELIVAFYDSARLRSGTRGIVLTKKRIVWKHIMPSSSYVSINELKSFRVEKDFGLSLSTWKLIANNNDDLSIRLSGIDKDDIPMFIAGIISFIRDHNGGRNIPVTFSKEDAKEFSADLACLVLLSQEKYDKLFRLCQKRIKRHPDSYSGHYMMALAYANKFHYPEAMQALKMAVKCKDFYEDRVNIKIDFKNHPLIIYSIPEDIRDLAFSTNQLFELKTDTIKNQTKFNELSSTNPNPPLEIQKARMDLQKGLFDTAYIEYMQFISKTPQLTDENLNSVVEALSIWKVAYVARIQQISHALNNERTDTIDPGFIKMIDPAQAQALDAMGKKIPPSVVDAYRGRYNSLLETIGNARETEQNIKTVSAVAIPTSFLITGGLISQVVAYELYDSYKESSTEEAYKVLITLPTFKISQWKEATMDYSRLKSRYKECMSLLNKYIQREKRAGQLSSTALSRLTQANILLENYFIYIDKIYRAFLFDSPMKLNLINFELRIKFAKSLFNDNEEKIQEVGRQYSKLTPVLKYIVLDNTHRDWEALAKNIKKELDDEEFQELKQEAKTLPNWFVEIES
jgi:tetratricopeptide (TPR) repeat protein